MVTAEIAKSRDFRSATQSAKRVLNLPFPAPFLALISHWQSFILSLKLSFVRVANKAQIMPVLSPFFHTNDFALVIIHRKEETNSLCFRRKKKGDKLRFTLITQQSTVLPDLRFFSLSRLNFHLFTWANSTSRISEKIRDLQKPRWSRHQNRWHPHLSPYSSHWSYTMGIGGNGG